ncbi:MAG: DctP family TRAP transporter solute-binding subunit [Planctomycetota bacterium]|jgi:tripartite ATP-independent transporter DctP family solute receptor|nr:DctP family TRAP transporter solute-binding subunit [Planctomycetota bacterium]
MNLKKIVLGILCLAAALGPLAGTAPAGQKFEARVSACNSLDHPQTLGLLLMKQYVEEKTGGNLVVHIFPNSQLAAEVESLEQVQMGTLEMATASIGPVVTFQEKFAVLDIPFLFNDYPEAWAVLDSKIGSDLFVTLQEVGMYGLGWYENGYRHTTNNIRPIKSLEDFKGLKIRTMQAPLHMLNFRQLGANPTPVPFSELYMAMAQKIADGQENPIANIWDVKLAEVQKYTSLTGHIYDAMPLVANLNWFKALPGEYQNILETGALLGQNYSRFINYDREELIVAKLRAAGMEINEVSLEAKNAIKAVSQTAVADEVKKNLGDAYVGNFLAGIEKVRADIKKSVE